jgi:hypothetical protein
VQYFEEASQKFTCPGVTAAPPEVTVAVRVTTLPDATELVAVPPEVTAIAVDVAAFDCAKTVVAITQSPMVNAMRAAANPTVLRERLIRLRAARPGCNKTKIAEKGSIMD